MLFQGVNLLSDEIHIHPGIFNSFLFWWPRSTIEILLVCRIAILLYLRIGVILSDPDINVFHLELILALGPNSFKWLLTDSIDLVF